MKKPSLFVLALLPLGAGLLFLGDLVPTPVAERAPAATPLLDAVPEDSERLVEMTQEPRDFTAGIAYVPARVVYLETLLLEGDLGQRRQAIRDLEALGDRLGHRLDDSDAVAALSIALADEDKRVVTAALEALARVGTDDALAAIASAQLDSDPRIRSGAAEAFGSADSYSSVDYLNLALRDDDPGVREAAIESLADLGDSRSINIIGEALRDADPAVRERAAELLDEMSDEAMFHALFPPQ